jgi:hypothetical protein
MIFLKDSITRHRNARSMPARAGGRSNDGKSLFFHHLGLRFALRTLDFALLPPEKFN